VGLLDDLRRVFADAEISLVGRGDDRLEAERALAARDWFRARVAAKRVLDRAPWSPIGLALLADACEGAGLDAELEETLVALARVAGGSPEIWLRLGRVRIRVGAPDREVREPLIRALSWDDDPDPERRWSARRARLLLASRELEEPGAGRAARAEGWLAPLDDDDDVRRLRLAAAAARRALPEIERLVHRWEPAVTDGEGQRIFGEAQRLLGAHDLAVRALCRAAILGDAQAVPALREALAAAPALGDAALRTAEVVTRELGVSETPLFRAAFAAARGAHDVAAAALREVLASGPGLSSPSDRAAARAVAVAARDDGLLDAVSSDPRDRILASAARTARDGGEGDAVARALDDLLDGGRADAAEAAWRAALVVVLTGRLVPDDAPAAWPILSSRLAAHARALADLEALRRIESIAEGRARPVRVAIVGEFNAGKSTFVNALLGMDVAPTGILPTTAVAHVLRYGPDPIARARLRGGGARTVAPDRLKSLLAELGPGTVSEVEVEVPFPHLQRIEIVDTPGFNAPDPEHARTALATLAGDEGPGVDLAVWLFDAGQAFKTSERKVLETLIARRIPVQALLNKCDRIAASEVETVLARFHEDARSVGLRSFRPPLAFSARMALAAIRGADAEALAASRFDPVRALLEDEVPAHGELLKERGLRRRAHEVVHDLLVAAGTARDEARALRTGRQADEARLRTLAALVERAAALDAGAAPSGSSHDAEADTLRRALREELRLAIEGFRSERAELAARDHPSMRSYLERRLAELLAQAGGRAIATALDLPSTLLDRVALDAEAVARGFAAGGPEVAEPRADRARADATGPLVRALLAVVGARLRAAIPPADEADVGGPLAGRARELAALEERLARPPASGAQPR
jgi:GTP-binding protein EngB required for normal cell division